MYLRFGVPYTANSLIHCACVAIGYDKYMSAKNREEFVKNIRHNELIEFAVAAKQEIYDLSTEEIIEELKGNNWLDPRRYYRVLEEWMRAKELKISEGEVDKTYRLFMFENPDTGGVKIMLPRRKLCHIRDYNEKATLVLLFVHTGQECNNATHEQVELIVSRTKTRRAPEIFYTFDNLELLRKIQRLLFESTLVRRLDIIESQGQSVHSVLRDPHDVESANELFYPLIIISQHIDTFGKLRAVKIEDEDTEIVVLTPPLAPLNVNEENLLGFRSRVGVTASIIGRIKGTKNIKLYSSNDNIVMNGGSRQGKAKALHFYLSTIADPFTVLVVPEEYEEAESVKGISYIELGGNSELEKLQRLKSALPRILNHVEDEYSHIIERGETITPEEHIRRTCRVEEGFDYMTYSVVNEKAILDSKKMYDWMINYVDKFLRVGLRLPKSNLAPSHEPFGTSITYIPTTDMLENWQYFLSYANPGLQNNFDNAVLVDTYQPYFFNINGDILCIQMVKGRSQENAVACAYNWMISRVNTGYNTIPLEIAVTTKSKGTDIIELNGTTLEVLTIEIEGRDVRIVRVQEYDPDVVNGKNKDIWGALLYIGTV